MMSDRSVRSVGVLFVFLVAALLAGGRTARAEAFDGAGFAARVEALRAETAVPGLAVAVVQDGETIFLEGFGEAGPDGRAATGRTPFRAGSVSKSFTALVVLQLAAEGRLDPDDPVVEHLPAFRTRDRAASDRITIDHLATHRSGLSTLDGNRRYGAGAVLAALSDAELESEPGSRFEYSNANYAVLLLLIEALEERPFEEVLARRILEPLGMDDSDFGTPPPGEATGYRTWFEFARPAVIPADRAMLGAGGLWSTAEDLARYVIALQTGDPRIVPPGEDRLFSPRPIHPPHGYAYGWFVYEEPAGDLLSHEGAVPGFGAMVALDASTGRSVVVLTNLFGVLHGRLAQAVVHEALGLEPVAPGPTASARVALWSCLSALLGFALWLYKTGRRLFARPSPMRPWVRWLNVAAVLGLAGGIVAGWMLVPRLLQVSLTTAARFFPDLTLVLAIACGAAALLAAGRLVLVIRGG